MRTATTLAAAIALVLATACRHEPQQPPQNARPNVLFILLDDLRWNAVGYAGHPYLKTPHIVSSADEGVNCRNAFCASPWRHQQLHRISIERSELPVRPAEGRVRHRVHRQVSHG